MSDELRDLARMLGDDPRLAQQFRLRQATVLIHFIPDEVTLTFPGSSTPVDGVRFLNHFWPKAGDSVWVLQNGPDLLVIGTVQQTGEGGWKALTLGNSWVNYGGGVFGDAYYRKHNGVVYLMGLIKSGTMTSGTVIATLPAGYRPIVRKGFPAMAGDGGVNYATQRIDVAANGQLITQGPFFYNAYVFLDAISFIADN